MPPDFFRRITRYDIQGEALIAVGDPPRCVCGGPGVSDAAVELQEDHWGARTFLRFACECSQASQSTEQLWVMLLPRGGHIKYLGPTVVLWRESKTDKKVQALVCDVKWEVQGLGTITYQEVEEADNIYLALAIATERVGQRLQR